jgi:hypothetical protein
MADASRSPRPRASFGVAKSNALGVLLRAKIMYAAIVAAIALFPSPTVTMAAFLLLIEALETAQDATTTKTKGLASLRNTKRDAVWTAMESLRIYIQGLADVVTAENAAALIEAAGLLVAGRSSHPKAILQSQLTSTPGVVHLIANATILVGKSSRKNVTFNWAWSLDGGKTWTLAASTPLADTFVPNLTPMTSYLFRVSVTVSRVTGDWSQPVGLLVH